MNRNRINKLNISIEKCKNNSVVLKNEELESESKLNMARAPSSETLKDQKTITFYKVKEDDSKRKKIEVVQSANTTQY